MDETAQLNGFDWWDGVYATGDETPHGGMEFNSNEHTVVHVPQGLREKYVESGKFEAWIGIMQEDDGAYPLWWIVNYGVVGREYTVSDALTAVYVDVFGTLYAKDDNHWLTPDAAGTGEEDFMQETGLMEARANEYDQSNWVILDHVASPLQFINHRITGMTVKGVLLDKRNPALDVTSTPQAGDNATYMPNTYIAASLMGRTQTGNNGVTYAFVRPKPQEVAYFEWTVYGGDDAFYLPAPDVVNGVNQKGIKGGFGINGNLYETAVMPSLEYAGYYPFTGIVRRQSPSGGAPLPRRTTATADTWQPYTESGISQFFEVFPLELTDEPVVTGIDPTTAGKQGKTVYTDMLGRTVKNPTPGIYIVNGKKQVVGL